MYIIILFHVVELIVFLQKLTFVLGLIIWVSLIHSVVGFLQKVAFV
jgi:hypothetical protein